jgi:hypothetical protein
MYVCMYECMHACMHVCMYNIRAQEAKAALDADAFRRWKRAKRRLR